MTAMLDQLNIVSDDLDATVAFYRSLGLPLCDPHRTPSGEPFHSSSETSVGA